MPPVHTERRATGTIRTGWSRLRIEVVFAGFGSPPTVGHPRARPAGTSLAGPRRKPRAVVQSWLGIVSSQTGQLPRPCPASRSFGWPVHPQTGHWTGSPGMTPWTRVAGGKSVVAAARGDRGDSSPRIDSPHGRRRRRSDRFGSLLSLSASRLRCEAHRATGRRRACDGSVVVSQDPATVLTRVQISPVALLS
jgi:hypothetical protein